MKVLCQIHIETNADRQHRKNVPYIRRDPRFFAIVLFGSTPTLPSACKDRLCSVPATVRREKTETEDAVLIAGWEGVEAIWCRRQQKGRHLFHLVQATGQVRPPILLKLCMRGGGGIHFNVTLFCFVPFCIANEAPLRKSDCRSGWICIISGLVMQRAMKKASIRIPQPPCQVKQCSKPTLKNLPPKLRLRTFWCGFGSLWLTNLDPWGPKAYGV